jgi:hypothetical protein
MEKEVVAEASQNIHILKRLSHPRKFSVISVYFRTNKDAGLLFRTRFAVPPPSTLPLLNHVILADGVAEAIVTEKINLFHSLLLFSRESFRCDEDAEGVCLISVIHEFYIFHTVHYDSIFTRIISD